MQNQTLRKTLTIFMVVALPLALILLVGMAAAPVMASTIVNSAASPNSPSTTQILGGTAVEGNLRISIYDNGTMNVERYTGSAWVVQIFAYSGQNPGKGSRLQSSDGPYRFGGESSFTLTGTQGNPISNTTSGNTVTTIWSAGAISVTQRTTYNDGNSYFSMEWDLTNNSGAAITDLRFFHGEDTYLSGGDNGAGFWITATNTIGAQKTVGGNLQRMMLQGITAPYAHQSENYAIVGSSVNAGALTNAVNAVETTDNGYALEWRQATLNAGETWNITAYEKLIADTVGALLVIAPTATDCEVGSSCDLTYTVQNDTVSPVDATFTISGTLPWGQVITSPGISATIPGNGSIPVVVQVSVPAGTADGTTGNFTLTANDGTTDSSDTAAVQAIVVPMPQIDVQGNGQSIVNGDTTPSVADDTDFGSTYVSGGTVAHTFTISNTGDADLLLTENPAVTLTVGTHFNISAIPGDTTIVSGTATTFAVTFDPAAEGSFTDTLNIANNDADEHPFTFVILGTGTLTPPTATTDAATAVSTSGATLNGTVNANNASTTVTFEYGLTTSYGSTVTADQSPVTGSSDTAVSAAITGLTADTTYHYRVVGVNAGGTTNGADMTFTTDTVPALEADLAISVDAVRAIGVGVVTYTVTIQNAGPDAADGAVFATVIPADVTGTTWTCAAAGGAACNPSGAGNTISEAITTLPSGGSVTYTIVGAMGVFGDESVIVTVTAPAGVTDPDLTNNTAIYGAPYRILLPFIYKNATRP